MTHLNDRPRYAAYAPHPALRPYILCIWSLHSHEETTEPSTIRVLPDGCMDVIFDRYGCLGPSGLPMQPGKKSCFITSPTQSPEQVCIQGRVEVVGVRFRPGGAAAFLGARSNDFNGENVNTNAVFPELANEFMNVMMKQERLEKKVHAIQQGLLRIGSKASSPDALSSHAITLLARDHGATSIALTVDRMGINRRTLERSFRQHVGISPKQLAKIIRLQHVIAILRSGSPQSLALIAQKSDYADQAHFIREFKKMTSVTPLQFLAEHHHVAFVQYDLPNLR